MSYLHDAAGLMIGGYWGNWNAFIFQGNRELADYEGDGLYFAHASALGTISEDTNWAGTAGYEVLFYPWGEVWQNPTGQIGNHLHQVYAGLPDYDPRLDQSQPWFRRYQPGLGRWAGISPAPSRSTATPTR